MKGIVRIALGLVVGAVVCWGAIDLYGRLAIELKQPHDLVSMIGMNQYGEVIRFVDAKGISSCTTDAFFSACSREDDATIAWYLLKSGVDPKAKQAGGRTALHAAAKGRSPRLIDELVRRGLDVNATTDLGRTPLDMVLIDEIGINAEMACTLIKHGARLMNPDYNGQGPKRTEPMSKQETLQRVYAKTFHQGDSADSKLIELGLDPTKLVVAECSRLMLNALHSFDSEPEWLKTLLQRGAGPNRTVTYDGLKMPLLHAACLEGKPDAVRLLLRYGANPKAKDGRGRTAFELVASKEADKR